MPASYQLITFRRTLILAAVVAVLLLGLFISGQLRTPEHETVRVVSGRIVEEVPANGRVEPEGNVNLSFEYGGRAANVAVAVGDRVAAGDLLIELETGVLNEELARTRAELSVRLGGTGQSEVNLERIKAEQDTLVENAYRRLLSEGLAAMSATSENYPVSAPVITGLYEGEPGTYRLSVRRELDGRNQLSVSDLERVPRTTIEADRPTPVGTLGLFVSFPDDASLYHDTVWHVVIPNIASATYIANYGSYQQALQARQRTIAEAEAFARARNGGATIAAAETAVARSAVDRVEREMAGRSLRATFSGVVTRVEARPGETVSAGQTIVSVMPEGMLQVAANVSENNIVNVRPGQKVRVVLDALGREFLEGVVAKIDPAESIISGAVYYKATILLGRSDERIRSGMTANVWIETAASDGALLLPAGAITRDGDVEFVHVPGPDGRPVRRNIVTGLWGSNGLVEVVSGLGPTDTVIIDAS